MTQEYEELKLKGNGFFKEERYQEAVDCYTKALKLKPQCHLLYSNRSAGYNKLGKYEEALTDAICCTSISPLFARGYYRKATALNELGKYAKAKEAAGEGYKLRGSDKICKDCVAQWLRASRALLEADVARIKDIPPGASPVSCTSIEILSRLQLEHSKVSGVSIEFMEAALKEVIAELEHLLKLFGHSMGSHACAWVNALTQVLKADPRTHLPPETAVKDLSIKSDQFRSYLNSDVDTSLYPIIRPILVLAILHILTCVSSLSRVISSRDMIQCLVRSCLSFFEKSVLSGKQYIRIHIDALQQLLNSYCMESGHANPKERREKEKEEVQKLSKKLNNLLEQYPSTADDYSDVKKSTMEILENSSLLLSPTLSQSSRPLTKGDAEMVKAQVAKEMQTLELLTESDGVLHFRHMDSLILATGGLVYFGEVQQALEVLKLSESLYFRVITELFESQLLSLDAEPFFHPQAMMHANSIFLEGIDNISLANIYLRWKCLFSELYAILVRLGIGKCLTNTFQKIEQFKVDGQRNVSQNDVLAEIADSHQKEVKRVLCEWGPKVVKAFSTQSYEAIQKQLSPDQVVLEYCMAAFYDTKCHPVPIPPKCLGVRGVLIVIQSEGIPVVKVLDFNEIQDLAVKTHDSAMKAVAARQSGKRWHHLQTEADKIASSLLQKMLPSDIQSILDSCNVKRVLFCPDQILAKVPIEMLPFRGGVRFGDKYAIAYLSSAKELLRDSIVESLHPSHAKPSRQSSQCPCHDCCFFANPNFDLRQPKSADSFNPWSQVSSVLTSFFSKTPEGSSTKASPLPDAETEVKEIENLLMKTHGASFQSRVVVGDDATLHQVLHVQSPHILHFATHGFSSPDFHYQYRNFWSDTRSGILLAGSNTYRCSHFDVIVNEAGTGELTALAACGMALEGTSLVYLSTCRSTYGFVGRGEALSSLAQSFRSAGAQTVLATMWPVADEVARKLALYFYTFASKTGVPPSIALQEAKNKIQKDGYDHWYDWAAFMCIGTDMPLFVPT